ncbi:MAG: acyl carrier protein [Eubacteriales bacterium]|nr:acyl carrier protein [Eubacteriales bacterium]MDD3199108.1 acyl carrier protein [Eubacteriales bacterium]MDD4629649.1 acyl carrier protein [Eubacteriales bacterium]
MSYDLSRNEIEKMVRNEFTRLTKKECNIDGDMLISKGLGIDSLYMLEMYAMIESNFGVMIPTEELQNMKTINKIVDTIIEYRK